MHAFRSACNSWIRLDTGFCGILYPVWIQLDTGYSWIRCVQLRSAFGCVQPGYRSAFSCVQEPAFSCVLRSAAFCVQLRSAFCVQLRSAFGCVLRSAAFRNLRSAAFCVQLRSRSAAFSQPSPGADGAVSSAQPRHAARRKPRGRWVPTHARRSYFLSDRSLQY